MILYTFSMLAFVSICYHFRNTFFHFWKKLLDIFVQNVTYYDFIKYVYGSLRTILVPLYSYPVMLINTLSIIYHPPHVREAKISIVESTHRSPLKKLNPFFSYGGYYYFFVRLWQSFLYFFWILMKFIPHVIIKSAINVVAAILWINKLHLQIISLFKTL